MTYEISGSAKAGEDFTALPGTVTIPAEKNSILMQLEPISSAHDDSVVVLSLKVEETAFSVGCPAASLVVIRR